MGVEAGAVGALRVGRLWGVFLAGLSVPRSEGLSAEWLAGGG